jgi:hypothetical protein
MGSGPDDTITLRRLTPEQLELVRVRAGVAGSYRLARTRVDARLGCE